MRRLLATLAFGLGTALTAATVAAPPAAGQPGVAPAGAQIPDGPAKAWLIADMDTGRVLASKDPYGSYAPASTIKPLLAMVVLDHLRPDNFARANQSHTKVECSCVGLTPGQPTPPANCSTPC